MKPPPKRKAEESMSEPSAKMKPPLNQFFQESEKALDKRITDAIITFLADSGVAYSVIGRSSFVDLMKTANKRINLKSPKTYMRLTKIKAEEIDKSIKDIIMTIKEEGDLKSVAFTTDIWTSRSQDSYMSLTIHFIDKFWHLHRLTPFVKPFPEKHTGVNIGLGLENMIMELNLNSGNIDLICVNDNASNMKLGIKLTSGLDQYFCDIHTLELSIGDTFKNIRGMSDVLRKARALAKLTHQSNVALEELKKEAFKEKLPFRKLKNPPDTRWSGRLDNMISVLHLKKAIKNLCNEKESWEDHSLTSTDWKLLEGAVKCLKPVKKMVKTLEGEKEPTIDKVIAQIFNVHTALREFINNTSNCGYGIGFARELKKQVEHRFPDKGTDRVQRRIANYLSPNYRGAHLDMYGKLESTKDDIELKIRSYENFDTVNEQEEPSDKETDIELSPTSKLIKRHAAKLKRGRTDMLRPENKVRKEMERYESFSFPRKVNILEWWKAHEGVLPLLASLAKRVLTIPSSSAKSERVFSSGGNIVTAKRNRLSPKNVQNLLVIKENMDMVDNFMKYGGYVVRNFDDKKNPFVSIEVEEYVRPVNNEEEVDTLDWMNIEEEDIIYLDDDVDIDDESADSDNETDPRDEAFCMDD